MDKSELKLGEETLDRDHEELHALITRLLGASADDMVPALDALRAHAAQHFAMEDEHLRDMKDGNSKCHLDEHANVLKSFDAWLETQAAEREHAGCLARQRAKS